MKPSLIMLALALSSCAGRAPGSGTGPVATPAPTETAQAASPATAPAAPPPALRLGDDVAPTEYAVELTVDPAQAEVKGTMTIAVELKRATRLIWLHGKRLVISKARVAPGVTGMAALPADARVLTAAPSFSGEFLALALPEAIGPGPARLDFEYTAQALNTEQEGIFRQTEAGNTYVFTQFESTAARLAFPCFDEPSFKVPWKVSLRVPEGLVALGNTPEESSAVSSGFRTVRFKKSKPLPSYLIALAVGPFDLIDLGRVGRGKTPMRIAVPKGRAAEARYASKVSGELLRALERYFDMPYPYEKLDSVVIPDFPGAMENAGLVTYGAGGILAKPSAESPAFQQGYAETAAHEFAHHWFGNLVTTAWWDDIWLNEAFATFMADRVLDDWQKSWGVAVKRVKTAEHAFGTDSLITARKVHNPIREHNDIAGAFDEISYVKGGALLDMFEGWMGREPFAKAIRRYLAAHTWGNATSKDFIAALAAESKPEIAAGFRSFIEQGGFPLVSLGLDCPTGAPPALLLQQERFLPIGSKGVASQSWSVPMCVSYPRGSGADHVQCFLLSEAQARVPLASKTCPASVDGNARRGYYRVVYAGDLEAKLLGRKTADPALRAARLFNAKALVDAGRSPMKDLLPVIPGVARERHPEVVGVAASLAESIEPFVSADLRPRYARFLADNFAPAARKLGFSPRAGESTQTSNLRRPLLELAALAGRDPALGAEAGRLTAKFLAAPDEVDPALASVALATAARADASLYPRLEAAFGKTSDHNVRSALLAGMVMGRGPGQREKTLGRLTEGGLVIEEVAAIIFTAMLDPEIRTPTFDFLVDNFEKVTATLSPMVRPFLVRTAGFFCDQAHRQQLDTVLRAKVKDIPGGSKQVEETLERLDVCIARRAKLGPDVAAFLAKLGERA